MRCSFEEDFGVIQLATRSEDPYSVNIAYAQRAGRLYVYAGDTETQWVKNMETNPAVRRSGRNMIQDRLAVINGLRGLAICAVIYHHVFSMNTPPGTWRFEFGGWTLLPLAPLSNGWLGVSLFFVLSGFVLSLPYERQTRRMASRADTVSFFVRRAARLLPLYYLVSLVCFIFLMPAKGQTLANFMMLLTVTLNFSQGTFFPAYNWVLWSLGIEIWMSMLFPLLWIARRKLGLGFFFGAASIFATAVRIFGNQSQFWDGNPVLNWVKDGLGGRVDDFALGMVLAAVFVRWGNRRFGSGLQAAALALAAGTLFLTCEAWDLIRVASLDRSVAPLLNNLFQVACASGVLGLLYTSNAVLRFLISNRAIQLLGMMCYSLYVWHGILIARAGLATPGGYNAQNIAIYFVWLGLLSALSYRYIEFGHVREARLLFLANPR
jgi:peptidoglycan/LPS O-acetylase OafA/YrhL